MIRMHPIETRGLDHVVLRVSDVERSIVFYSEVLGLPVERRMDDAIEMLSGRKSGTEGFLYYHAPPTAALVGHSGLPKVGNRLF